MFTKANNQKQSNVRVPKVLAETSARVAGAPAETSACVASASVKTSGRRMTKAAAKTNSPPKASTALKAADEQLKKAERGRDGKFRQGHSGNPAGRPKNRAISEVMRDMLQETAGRPLDLEGRTNAEVIAGLIVKWAAKGNLIAAREILDRTEGKAKQSLAIHGSPLQSEEWIKLRTKLVNIAERHPEFREEVLAAIYGEPAEDPEKEGGHHG
jgi:hypothetical protein